MANLPAVDQVPKEGVPSEGIDQPAKYQYRKNDKNAENPVRNQQTHRFFSGEFTENAILPFCQIKRKNRAADHKETGNVEPIKNGGEIG